MSACGSRGKGADRGLTNRYGERVMLLVGGSRCRFSCSYTYSYELLGKRINSRQVVKVRFCGNNQTRVGGVRFQKNDPLFFKHYHISVIFLPLIACLLKHDVKHDT